ARTIAADRTDRADETRWRTGGRDRRGRPARGGRILEYRRGAVVRGAQSDRARICRRRRFCAGAGEQGQGGVAPAPYAPGGGGRNTTSCLADSATTSGGLCSFIEW